MTTAELFRVAFRGTFVSPALYRLPENPGGGLATSPGKSRPGGARPTSKRSKKNGIAKNRNFPEEKI